MYQTFNNYSFPQMQHANQGAECDDQHIIGAKLDIQHILIKASCDDETTNTLIGRLAAAARSWGSDI